jgi:hypothetical protein
MNAHFECNHSQNSPNMASQRFHSSLCPRGNQLQKVKFFPPAPLYPTNCQLCIIHVICPNGCNMRQHWLYLSPPSVMLHLPNFPCLKMNGFELMWTTIIHHPKALEYEAQQLFQMHYLAFSHLQLSISTLDPSMLLCNIVRLFIKSQTIVNIFEDHKCNVPKNSIYICTLEKTHQ